MGEPVPQNGAVPHGLAANGSHISIAMGKDEREVQASAIKNSAKAHTGPAHTSSIKRVATNASILRSIELHNKIVLRFEDVSAWVPTLVIPGTGQPGKMSQLLGKCRGEAQEEDAKQQPSKERQVLFGISGEVNPGEVLALMGPSGGGKTSLLALLGGRSTARVGGAITFNGLKMSKPVKRKMGYVMQDDLLYAQLTVYETLYFAALLRLPRSWTKEDKLARVEMVVAGLGLERCRDTIIGSHMMRGVSGGERKRVSIGHELLINPSMLLLDEPTSGLDSTTALRLMHTLRTLAGGGRTIITSIHQPSSRLYRQMDKLMLLSEGRCMFYGDAQSVAPWFMQLGQACPFGTNIADHILDLANGDVQASNRSTASRLEEMGEGVRRRHAGLPAATGDGATAGVDASGGAVGGIVVDGDAEVTASEVHQELVAAFEHRKFGLGRGGICAADLEATDTVMGSPRHGGPGGAGGDLHRDTKPQANGSAGEAKANGGGAEGTSGIAESGMGEGDDKWGASWVDQVRHLTVRCVKTRRFSALSTQEFIQILVVAVLAGLFWWQVGQPLDSGQTVLDVGGLLFFIEQFMGIAALFTALFTFPAEFQMLVKERQSGMYRLSAYYVARTLSDLPMDCLLPSLFTCIAYWMTGLRISAGAFFAHWAAIVLIVLVSQSVGLLIGATVVNLQNGMTVAAIFMLSTMLVGGYFVRGIPVWISWIKYLSFIYWGWNLLLKIEFSERPYTCDLVAGATDGRQCTVAEAGVFPIDVDATVTREVLVLIAMLIFLRLCIYYALKYKATFKGRK